MTRHTFSMLAEHRQRLRSALFRDENEYGALLLCGRSKHLDPWTGEVEERAIVREVIEVDPSAFSVRTPTSMTWSTTPLFQLCKRAAEKDFAICVAHCHPTGGLLFSPADDVADKESFEIVFGRLQGERPHFSMVMIDSGEFLTRAYGPALQPASVDLVRVVGDRLDLRYARRGDGISSSQFDRQARVFGARSVEDLRRLRIGIVGCGGTGSAVAALLTRLGASRIVLIDGDKVDTTNLSRLHFSERADAVLGRYKVDVVGEAMARIGLADSVVRIAKFVDDPACSDALRACDVIFGCTDDHLGRMILNRLAHFYLIPVIDLGVLIEPRDSGGYDTFDGRVTVVQPGSPCQWCRKLIRQNELHAEALRRNDPTLYEQRRRAGYVPSLGEPSPAVVTFTTEVASMAVNELLHRLTGFRGKGGHCAERIRRLDAIKDPDLLPGCSSDPDCPLCGTRRYDGRGDVSPFLDIA